MKMILQIALAAAAVFSPAVFAAGGEWRAEWRCVSSRLEGDYFLVDNRCREGVRVFYTLSRVDQTAPPVDGIVVVLRGQTAKIRALGHRDALQIDCVEFAASRDRKEKGGGRACR